MPYSEDPETVDKLNTRLRTKCPELFDSGIRVVGFEHRIVTTGEKLRKRREVFLSRGCQRLSVGEDRLFDRRTPVLTKWELCVDADCTRCQLERFDIEAYARLPRGGIWLYDENAISPLLVKKTDSTKYWYRCVCCEHKFKMAPSRRDDGEQRQCMFCSRSAKRLCGDTNCKICIAKSLLTRQNIMNVFNKDKNPHPATILSCSNIDLHLTCPCCKKDFVRNIRTINYDQEITCEECKKSGIVRQTVQCRTCPKMFDRTSMEYDQCMCCRGVDDNTLPMCGRSKEDCVLCYDRSFAKRYEDEHIADAWSADNPPMIGVSRRSGRKFSFVCRLCKCPYDSDLHKNTIQCPKLECRKRFTTEQYIRDLLHTITGKWFHKNRSLPWLADPTNSNILELDGHCLELNMAFEYQGEQHYILTHFNQNNPATLENIQRKDALKVKLCKDNGVHLIVIPYTIPCRDMETFLRSVIPPSP
jgi:hypothetical protein